MSERTSVQISLEHNDRYEFTVKFAAPDIPPLTVDEPAPLGTGHGPNAGALLAAAVANCLSASLLFCLHKDNVPAQQLRAQARVEFERDEHNRLRIAGIHVDLTLAEDSNNPRLARCRDLFEDFCVVTESVRRGIPVSVNVVTGES